MATMLERTKNVKAPKKTHAEHMEDALYREVWEDVNNEKTMKFIKKYSKHIWAAALAIMIIATGFQIGVRTYQQKKTATAVAYESALMSADANALYALAGNTSGATGDLALFQAYLLDKDVAKLTELANNGDTRDFRDLARLHIIGLQGDEMTADAVADYLSDVLSRKSPYYYSAALTVAQKYLSVGDRDAANKWLDKIINDESAPSVISATAQTLR